MATVVVHPSGDGTTIQFTPTAGPNNFDEVNTGIGAPDDATLVTTTNNSARDDFYDFDNMPGDFDTANDITGTMRTRIAGIVDDTISVVFDIFNSAESSLIEALASLGGNHGFTNTTGSAQANTDNAAAWDGYKMRVRMNRSNSGMPDAVTVDFSVVEATIDYDVITGPDIAQITAAAAPKGEPMVMRGPHEVVNY